MKLCVFDFDKTISNVETINELAREHGVMNDVERITTQAMEGRLSFFEALNARVRTLEGMSFQSAEAICRRLHFTTGAEETIRALKEKGCKIAIISGSFSLSIEQYANQLDVDLFFCNHLHHKNGKLTGEVGGEVMFDDSKGVLLEKIQTLTDISADETAVVADGANDLSMFPLARVKVAFRAMPKVQEAANVVVNEEDLTRVLTAIL